VRNKFICLSLVFVLVISFVNFGFCEDKKIDLIFLAGSPGGGYNLHAAGVIELVRRAYPEIKIDLRPGGSVTNVMNLGEGKGDLMFTHSPTAKYAELGIRPFKEKITNIRGIATTYGSKLQHITLVNSGINSIAQIKEEKMPVRVAVGRQGSATEIINGRLLELYGITYDDIKSWGGRVYFNQQADAANMMSAGKINLILETGACPLAVYMQLETTRKLKMLPLDEKIVDIMVERFGLKKDYIKRGAYNFVTEDTLTLTSKILFGVASSVPIDVVYKITKAVAEGLPYLYNVDQALKIMTKENMWQNTGVPLHPGAERYYREIGVIK